MTDQFSTSHPPGAAQSLVPDSLNSREGGDPLPREQLERLSELVANGETPLPEGLLPGDRQSLELRVRKLRRARLVQFIARQIALDIRRDQPCRNGVRHDQAQI